jgi:hypothetical protein
VMVSTAATASSKPSVVEGGNHAVDLEPPTRRFIGLDLSNAR